MTMQDLLNYLMTMKGSDLHILAGLPPAIRLHGDLVPVEGSQKLSPEEVQKLVYSILSPTQIQKYEMESGTRFELDFAYGIPNVGRFRCNVYRQRGTVGCVIRALASKIPSLDSLGLPASVHAFTEMHRGLVLVTGPTGSGKSTTLAAMIDEINSTRRCHIITIEDPIEYVHNSKLSFVSQREVGATGDTMSFGNALKYALRQDPDVILIGEMRDHETIGIAITSAETGHLVFGTLHTASASQTVGRIIDVFPSDQQNQVITQLAANIQGVVSQILLPRADGTGRAVASEVMKANTAIRNLIRTNNIDGIYQSIGTGAREGMVTMDASIAELVKAGIVSYEIASPRLRDEVTRRQIEPYKNAAKPAPKPATPPPAPAATPAPAAAPGAPRAQVGGQSVPVHQLDTPAPPDAGGQAPPRRTLMSSPIPPWEKKS